MLVDEDESHCKFESIRIEDVNSAQRLHVANVSDSSWQEATGVRHTHASNPSKF
jgi:hypothetical protein